MDRIQAGGTDQRLNHARDTKMDDTYYPRATRERADSFFDDNPEVIQCREVLAAAEEAHRGGAAAYQAAIGTLQALEARIAALGAQVGEAQGALKVLAAQCLQEGDMEFTAVVAAQESIQRLQWQHQAAKDAMPAAQDALTVARRPVEVTAMRTDNAGIKLREILKRLKLEHAHRSY